MHEYIPMYGYIYTNYIPCIYTYINTLIHTYTHAYIPMYGCIYTQKLSLCVCIVRIFPCMCVCVCVCVCVCMYMISQKRNYTHSRR